MKLPRLLAVAALVALPALAQAHPGHDGDHDFVWDFSHFAEHPLATMACGILVAAAGWGAWRLLKAKPAAKPVRIKRD
jgi:urease accessory protein